MNNKLKEYSDLIPKEVRNTLKSLGDDSRLGLFLALVEGKEIQKEYSFSKLKNMFEFKSSNLIHHLDSLSSSGLIENVYTKIPGSRGYSFYQITKYGQFISNKIEEVVEESIGMEIRTNVGNPFAMLDKPTQKNNFVVMDEGTSYQPTTTIWTTTIWRNDTLLDIEHAKTTVIQTYNPIDMGCTK